MASWYTGQNLMKMLDELKQPEREIHKPLRLNIANYFISTTGLIKGNSIYGKIQGGVLNNTQKCVIMPYGIVC